ncbi:hypothetical protein ABZV34_07740 [Streptomyces sp. NPDC005195]|uniref:hypothetical protein n=1 Tax=Streptomyces sp. NPDC005195 TaxID=3154561 RepID=UPI0033B9A45A
MNAGGIGTGWGPHPGGAAPLPPHYWPFLQTDSVAGGSANPYDYCNGDPVNCADTSGQCPSWKHPIKKAACKAAVWATEHGTEAVGEVFCGAVATVVFALCSAIVTGLSASVSYYVETCWDGGFSWGEAISNFGIAAFAGDDHHRGCTQ